MATRRSEDTDGGRRQTGTHGDSAASSSRVVGDAPLPKLRLGQLLALEIQRSLNDRKDGGRLKRALEACLTLGLGGAAGQKALAWYWRNTGRSADGEALDRVANRLLALAVVVVAVATGGMVAVPGVVTMAELPALLTLYKTLSGGLTLDRQTFEAVYQAVVGEPVLVEDGS